MANRSYLYSTNVVPSPDLNRGKRRIVGISEWSYDIPIVFKILLSGKPRKCRSLIWEVPEKIALAGEYDRGVARLFRFLDSVTHPAVAPLREEAHQFFTDEKNRNRYFVLECGEIFDMNQEPLAKQNERLLAELKDLQPAIDALVAALSGTSGANPGGSAAKLPSTRRTAAVIESLGLGNWSNFLYFDFSQK